MTPARPRTVLLVAATIAASAMTLVDETVVNVGLHAIGQDLHAGGALLPWVVNAYRLPLAALILLAGHLGDRFGHRALLAAGISVFAVASVAVAAAQAPWWLLCARFVQGVGAAAILPNSLAFLSDEVDPSRRGPAMGAWTASGALALALGPLIGGLTIHAVGWRPVFLLNVPIALVALVAASRVAPRADRDRTRRIDLPGTVLATVLLGGVAFGLGGSGAAASGLALLAAVASAVGLVRHVRRLGDAAIVPPDVLTTAAVARLNGVAFLVFGALAAMLLVLPFEAIAACAWPAQAAGTLMLPYVLTTAALAVPSGVMIRRCGARGVLGIGCLPLAAGYAGLAASTPCAHPPVVTFGAVAVVGAGMAMVLPALLEALSAAAPPGRTGVVLGLNNAVLQAGGLAAIAAVRPVLAAIGPHRSAAAAAAYGICCAVSLASAALVPTPRRRAPASDVTNIPMERP